MSEENVDFAKKVLIVLGLVTLALLLGFLVWPSVQMLLVFAGILFAIFVRGISEFLFRRLLSLPEKTGVLFTLLLLRR